MSNPTIFMGHAWPSALASVAVPSLQAHTVGVTFGADLVTNGTFTGDATGWTLNGNWIYTTNYARYSGPGLGSGGETMTQSISVIQNDYYRVQFDITGVNDTDWACQFSFAGYTTPKISSRNENYEDIRTYEFTFKALTTGGTDDFKFIGWGELSDYFAIDNVILQHCDTTTTVYTQPLIKGRVWPSKGSYTAPTSKTKVSGGVS